jgi:hypothetical protein
LQTDAYFDIFVVNILMETYDPGIQVFCPGLMRLMLEENKNEDKKATQTAIGDRSVIGHDFFRPCPRSRG